MFDIHAHILPFLDDGPEDWEESLEMCRIASADGIKTIVATPHIVKGLYDNSPEEISAGTQRLNELIDSNGIELSVLPGAELHISPDIPERLANGESLTINGNGKYVLIEIPFEVVPKGMGQLVFELLIKGVRPIISHPERNRVFQKKPELLFDFVSQGALSQVTAGSLSGVLGRRVRKCAFKLLERNLAHVIASDAHSSNRRSPVLSESVKAAEEIVGKERALEMVTTIPLSIIEGREVSIPDPL